MSTTSTTSTKLPTLARSQGSGSVIWQNPERVCQKTTEASAVLTGYGMSQELYAYGFGFDIPDDATITSIVFNISRHRSAGATVTDEALAMVLNDTQIILGSSTSWPEAAAVANIGGNIATAWKQGAIPASVVNDPMFGFVIQAGLETESGTAYVNYVECVVEYSTPSAQTTEVAYVMTNAATESDPVLTLAEITSILQTCRIMDNDGRIITDTNYVTTYDLNRAVMQAWELKAAKAAGAYAISDNGVSLHREQVQEQCLAMAKQWSKKLMGTIQIASPAIIEGIVDNYRDLASRGKLEQADEYLEEIGAIAEIGDAEVFDE